MVQKKTRAKAKKRAKKISPSKVAASKPLNRLHETALKVITNVIKSEDVMNAKVKSAEEKIEAAKNKFVATAKKAGAKSKTAAAKKAQDSAKTAIKKATAVLTDARIKARSASLAVKEAVANAESHRKKEVAKLKAVASFMDKWETSYDKSMAKKTKKKGRKTTKKKKAT